VLPRLFTIREEIGNATLLLPAVFQRQRYIAPSLKPFTIQEVKFVHEICRCENFKMPTHTAPSGNYNESIIGSLKDLYTDFYQNARSDHTHNKVYISRSKAQNKKIVNEGECIAILKEFGFKTVCFEDYSFQEQVNIALHAQYLISNHGAGLTNMFFMKPGSSVFELRQKEDAKHNCFFALASTVNLKYYYQLCDSENPGEDAHTASLIVDCQLFRKNIEQMLADGFKQSM
jgi:capsular polysaccharide biosynthesis protein